MTVLMRETGLLEESTVGACLDDRLDSCALAEVAEVLRSSINGCRCRELLNEASTDGAESESESELEPEPDSEFVFGARAVF
jgi:hypothetical protein